MIINNLTFEKGIYTLFFFFVFFQVSLGAFAGLSLRVYYFLIPLFFLLHFRNKKIYTNLVFYYFLMLTLVSLWYLTLDSSLNSFLFLLFSSFTCWILGFSISSRYSQEEVLKWFTYVAWSIIIFILLRTIVTLPTFLSGFVNRFYLVDYFFIAPGGWNVELTFISFLMILLRKYKVYWSLFFVFVMLEIVFQSRIGLLLAFASIFISPNKEISLNKVIKVFSGLLVSIVMLYLIAIYNEGGAIHRLLDFEQEIIDYDSGVGRLYTYDAAYRLLQENIFGYGVGRGIDLASLLVGGLDDANFHNIYIQILVDGGIISLLMLLTIFHVVFKEAFTSKFNNRYACVALAYLISGLVQFNGYDTIGWLFIGLCFGELRKNTNKVI